MKPSELEAFRVAFERFCASYYQRLGGAAITRAQGETHRHSSFLTGITSAGEPRAIEVKVTFEFGAWVVGKRNVAALLVENRVQLQDPTQLAVIRRDGKEREPPQ